MLFVTGANGHFAQAVIAALLGRDDAPPFAVGTRDPGSPAAQALATRGVPVRRLDFDEPSSLEPAFAGVDRALIIPTMAPNDRRLGQNRAALAAAQAAGVRHIVYASFINASAGSLAEHNRLVHYPTEQAIAASGLEHSFLRHALYAEIMTGDLDATLASGVLRRVGGDARFALIARDDLGVSAARVLAEDGHAGRTYTETMAETLSGAAIAATMADVFATPVRYEPVSAGDWPGFMHAQWGVPLEAARSSYGTMRAVESGEFDIVSGDYADITGTPPRSFRRFLEDVRDRRS